VNTTKKDPLLMTAKVLTIIVRIALVIGMIGLGIGIAGAVIASLGWLPEGIAEQIAIESDGVMTAADMWVVLLPMVGAMIVVGLSYEFVSRLAKMIDTVGEGDPFTMVNAGRLTRMAWLALGIEIVSFITSLLGDWVERRFEPAEVEFNSEFSFTGIALALVLFILARVFREGARMRAELEGTV
jgi:Protein of unknown function (DUF2975)